MQSEELVEKIERVVEELISLNTAIPVIVEGESDVRALRKLGLSGEIISINTGQSIFNFCEELSQKHDEVIILTDWDRKGGHLGKLITEGLKANGVKFNIQIRAKLAAYCRKETKDVEGLVACMHRLKNI
ncbi:MAG: topoisomerase [Thermoplasmata archaeon]|nr:MAG: topoisomerase [Thermoplasmata archaeon]